MKKLFVLTGLVTLLAGCQSEAVVTNEEVVINDHVEVQIEEVATVELSEGNKNLVTVVIPQGDYEVGDLFYITSNKEEKVGLLDYLFLTVKADEEVTDDVLAVIELDEDDVLELAEGDLEKETELVVDEEEDLAEEELVVKAVHNEKALNNVSEEALINANENAAFKRVVKEKFEEKKAEIAAKKEAKKNKGENEEADSDEETDENQEDLDEDADDEYLEVETLETDLENNKSKDKENNGKDKKEKSNNGKGNN